MLFFFFSADSKNGLLCGSWVYQLVINFKNTFTTQNIIFKLSQNDIEEMAQTISTNTMTQSDSIRCCNYCCRGQRIFASGCCSILSAFCSRVLVGYQINAHTARFNASPVPPSCFLFTLPTSHLAFFNMLLPLTMLHLTALPTHTQLCVRVCVCACVCLVLTSSPPSLNTPGSRASTASAAAILSSSSSRPRHHKSLSSSNHPCPSDLHAPRPRQVHHQTHTHTQFCARRFRSQMQCTETNVLFGRVVIAFCIFHYQ